MFSLKKDWLLEVKRLTIVFFTILLIFLAIFLITNNYESQNYWYILWSVLKSLTKVGTAIIALIPIIAFISVTPAGEKINDGEGCIKTNHLPFSKKQLAWRGIKLWFKIYPLWVIVSIFIVIIYTTKVEVDLRSSFLLNYSSTLIFGTIILIMFGMQFLGSIILSYYKNIIWYVITLIQVLCNTVFIYGGIFIGYKLGLDIDTDMRLMIAIFGILLVLSVIYFLYNFKNIEKVYR
ncbi:Uncharacterised protein [uncultured Clostridium sp.]|nr:Uncharacterised protein [uncultured Clostridium sp.]